MTILANMKKPSSILDQTLEAAFPDVDPGERPCGSLILIQVKRAATRTKGGLHLTSSDQQTEYDNTKVAKVIALGPLAFKNRETGVEWPERAWFKVGDYIRLSQHNATTWTVPLPGTRGIGIEERVVFGYMDELHVRGIVNDPMATEAFF
jgi:co-chaperonin GroES (HSP10)